MDSDNEDWELVVISVKSWGRVIRGLLTQDKLRKFWAQLGGYLKEVKRQGNRSVEILPERLKETGMI